MSPTELASLLTAAGAVLVSIFAFVRAMRVDDRAAQLADKLSTREEITSLQKQVQELQAQQQRNVESIARLTRYTGFLQYLLQKNGITSPTYEEWVGHQEQSQHE